MTSTNDGKDVKSNQTSGQKGKQYYITLYNSLDARLSAEQPLRERTQPLCEAWALVPTICRHALSDSHTVLLTWLERHTARVILLSEWQSPASEDDRIQFADALAAVPSAARAAAAPGSRQPWEAKLLERAAWFASILDKPWDHPVLRALLVLEPTGVPPSDDEVLEWMSSEREVVLLARLRQLAASKECRELAAALATAIGDRLREGRHLVTDTEQAEEGMERLSPSPTPGSFEARLRHAGFSKESLALLCDMELVLLLRADRRGKCIDVAKQTPLLSGYDLAQRLMKRADTAKTPRDRKFWKNATDAARLIAQVVIARCMKVPRCVGAASKSVFRCGGLLAALSSGEAFRRAAAGLTAPAPTSHHLYCLARGVHANAVKQKTMESMKTFICELYVRAITFGMNELEKLKLDPEKATQARTFESTLSSWVGELGGAVGSARVAAECALTAFSLHPDAGNYRRVADAPELTDVKLEQKQEPEEVKSEFGSWATDSQTQSNLVKTSEHLNMKPTKRQANVLSTAIVSEGEALGLGVELCHDIATILSGPRVKTLSWDMDRGSLLENCRAYMERTGGGTRAVTTELKFLNLDPSEYQHLPEEDDDESDAYYGIEKGYEHLVQFQEEPETIWQDALSDLERTESACSNSQDGLLHRKKSKQRIESTSDSDCDPLSSVAEAKRLEKKERPHSKERSRERRKSKKDRLKKKDEQERKEKKDGTEKKERKKKKKEKKQVENIGALSSLIGVKVARVTSIDEGKTDKVKNVCVTDSDYDSQGKSSLNSEENDTNVIYDGHFSMDELKSPERLVSDKVDGLDNRELSVSNGAISMNKADTPPKRDISNTANAIATPTAASCAANPQSVLKPEHSEVKKKISKLLQFRRQNTKPTESKDKQETVKSELSSLVGSKIIQATDVPKVNATEVPKVKATEEPKLKATKAPKVTMTKKQTDEINVLTNKVNHLLARNNLPAGMKVLNPSSQPELTKNNLPAGMKILNLSNPPELTNIPKVKRKNARKKNETCSRVRPIEYDYTKRKSKPLNSAIMQDATLIQNVTDAQNTVDGANPPCEYVNVTSTVVPQANQSHIMSQTSPTLKESHTSLPSTKIQSIRNPVTLQTPLKVLPPPSCTNLADSCPNMTTVETPSLIPTIQNKPAFDAQQTNFQEFLKTLQGSINDGMKSANKTPAIVTPAATPCKTEQMFDFKPVATQKKVENAPNTFARRSYMQKKQGKSVTAEPSQQEQIALQNSISAEIDQRIANLRHHKMTLNNNLLLTNQEVTKSKETNMARVEVQTIGEPTRMTPKEHMVLNRLLTPSTLNMFKPVLGNENPTLEVKSIPRAVSSPVSSNSMLTEKDQQDLMLLLRQQSNINASSMQKRSEISSFNAVKISNVPAVKVISSGNIKTGIFGSKLISNPIEIPIISNTDAIRAADMVQLNKNSLLQNIPKETAINGPMNQKTVTVSEKKNYNATHKKSNQDWSQVLDAIRAQKTPSRGPNALDMAMQRSSYEKYVNDNVKNNIVPNTSGSQCAPKQKPINKRPTTFTVPKKSNVQPIESKKPTQIEIPKRTYQPDLLKRHSDDYTKTVHELQKGNDPFISGLENSDYDLLEELMDDELRQEIGELSDEDRYSSIKNPLSLPDQTSTKNNNTFNDPHKTGTSYKVIYDPHGLLNAQKDNDSKDKVPEKSAIKKGHRIKMDPQYVQSTNSEGTKIYKLSGKVETKIINSSLKPEETAKTQMLPSYLANSQQIKIVDTNIINSPYTPDDALKIQKLPGHSLKRQQIRVVETRTINAPYSTEVTPKIQKLPNNSSKTQPIKVLDTRIINPPYSPEITPNIQKLSGHCPKTQKMTGDTKIINTPYTPDTRNVKKLPGNSTKSQQIKIVDSKVINPPYIQNMSTKDSPKLQELLGTSSKSSKIKIMDTKIITPPYVQSTSQKDAPINHKISGNTSKKSRVVHGTPKNLILPIKTDNNKQIYNSTQQVNNSILNEKLNTVTYDQAHPQKSDAKGILITAVPKSAIGSNIVVIGAGGGALSVQPQQKTFVAISNAPNLILQPAPSPVLSPVLIGNTIKLPTTSQPFYASAVSQPVTKTQNLPTTSNLHSTPTSNEVPTIIYTPDSVKVEEKHLQHVPECRVDTKLKEPDVTVDIPKMMSRSINTKVENMTQDKSKLCERRVLSQVQEKLKTMPEIVVTKQPKMNKPPVENVASKDTANQERLKKKRMNIINREIKKPSQHPPIILSYSPLGLSKEKSVVKAQPVVKSSGLTNIEDTHVNKTDSDIQSEQSSEISNDTTKENKKNTQPRFLLRSCKKTMTTDSNKNVAIKTRVRLKTKSSDKKEADDSITETNENMPEDDKLNINIIAKSPNVATKDSSTQSPMRSSKRIRENRIKQQSAAELEAIDAVCDTISDKLDNLPVSNVEFDSFDIEEALTGSKIEKSVIIADALTNIEITSDDSIKRQLPNEKPKEIDMENKKATCSIAFPMSAPLKSDTEIQISSVEKQENTRKCTNDLLSNMEEKTRMSLECNDTFNIMEILNSSNVMISPENNNIVNTTEVHNSNNDINKTNNDISVSQIIEKAPVSPENNKTNTSEKTDQATSVARITDGTNNTITKAKSKTQDSVTEEKCKSFVELVNNKQTEEMPALCNTTVTKNLEHAIQDELDLDMDVEESKPVKAVAATFGKIMMASKRTTEKSKNALKPSRKGNAEKNEHTRNCIPFEKPNNSNPTTLQTVTVNFNSDSMDSGNNIRYTLGDYEVIVPEIPNNNIPNIRSNSNTNKNNPRIMTATSDKSANTTEKAVPLVEPMGSAKNNDICYDDVIPVDTYLEPKEDSFNKSLSSLLSSQIPIAKLNTNKKYIMVDNQTSDMSSEKSNNIPNVRSISKSDKNNPRMMTAVSDSNANRTEKTVPLVEATGSAKNNSDHDVIPVDSYSEPKEALSATRNSADNFRRTSEPENITKSKTDNLKTLESYKQKIKIEELPSEHGDPNKRTVRIELPNGKKVKATVYGTVPVSVDSIFENPAMKDVLLSTMKHTKRYSVSVQQVSTRHTNEVIDTVIQCIEPARVPLPINNMETVNLISDDEEDWSYTFVTEFGKYTVNNIETKIAGKHQTKFYQPCQIKLKRCDHYYETEPKLELNLIEDSPKVVKETVKLPDITKNNILQNLVDALLTDTQINKIVCETGAPTSNDVIEIEDTSSDSDSNVLSETLSNIDELKNKLLKDFGVKALSTTVTTKETKAPEKQTHKPTTKMQKLKKRTGIFKRDYSHIAKLKCCVKLIRCDDMLKNMFVNQSVTDEDTDNQDQEILSYLNSNYEPSDHYYVYERTSPVMEVFNTIASLRQCNNTGRNSPVMEVYDVIATLRNDSPANTIERTYPTMLRNCQSEWTETKRAYKYYENMESIAKAPINVSSVECNFTNLGAPSNDLKISCDSEWRTTKPNIHRLTLNVMDAVQVNDTEMIYLNDSDTNETDCESNASFSLLDNLTNVYLPTERVTSKQCAIKECEWFETKRSLHYHADTSVSFVAEDVLNDSVVHDTDTKGKADISTDCEFDTDYETSSAVVPTLITIMTKYFENNCLVDYLTPIQEKVTNSLFTPRHRLKRKLSFPNNGILKPSHINAVSKKAKVEKEQKFESIQCNSENYLATSSDQMDKDDSESLGEDEPLPQTENFHTDYEYESSEFTGNIEKDEDPIEKAKVQKEPEFESIQCNTENNLTICSDMVDDKNYSESMCEDKPFVQTENVNTDSDNESSEITANDEKNEHPIKKAKDEKEQKFESIQRNTEHNLTISSDPVVDKNDSEILGEDKPLEDPANVEKEHKFESIQCNTENNLTISSDPMDDKNDSESLCELKPLPQTENVDTDSENESSVLTAKKEKDENLIQKSEVEKEQKLELIQCNTGDNLTISSDPLDYKNDSELLREYKPLPQTKDVHTDSKYESSELTANKEKDEDIVIIIEDSVELTLDVETKMKQTSDTILNVENLTEMNNEDDVVTLCENEEILNDHDEVELTLDVETKIEETSDTLLVKNLTEINNEDNIVTSCENEEILNDHDEIELTLDVETKIEETSDTLLVENLTEMNNEDDIVTSCENEEILNDNNQVELTLEQTSDTILNVENLTEMNNKDDIVTSCENEDHDQVETKMEETSDTILNVENLTEMNNTDDIVTSCENEDHDPVETKMEETSDTILNVENLTEMNNEDDIVTSCENEDILNDQNHLTSTQVINDEISEDSKYLWNTEIFVEELSNSEIQSDTSIASNLKENCGHAESNEKEIVNESISTETSNKAEPLDDPSTCSESHALQEIELEVLKPKVTYLKVKHIRKRKAIYNNMTDTYFVKRPRTTNSKYRKGKILQCPNLSKKDMAEIYEKEHSEVINYISTVKFSFSVPFHKDYINVPELLTDWPIKTCPNDRLHENIDIDNNLFIDLQCNKSTTDPANLTLAEELSIENIEKVISVEKDENNFNVGFGEGSGRVIQNLANGGTMSTFSAATLSDVKHSQPFLLSVDHDTCDTKQHASNKNDEIEKIKGCATYIQLRDTVKTFFKNRYMELSSDHARNHKNDASTFPFEFYISNISSKVVPCPTEVIVQVVQVGQLPVSAAAQNPVTCDPRVTQVSNASPSQCSVDNSPHDESQPVIKTEYTELTTAHFTLPLVQDYDQHNDTVTAQSQETANLAMANENIPIETELIKSEVKIELIEDQPDDLNMESEDQLPPANHVNNLEYSYETNTVIAESDQNAQFPPENNNEETVSSQSHHNGSAEKIDQIAHAMNAAGITTTPETVPATRAHTLVNILSQKIISRQTASNNQNPPNNYPKTTSINAMSLQQALAQILPPPLNQTTTVDNQQSQNQQVTSQVLHIVQGKNASGNQITLMDNSQPSVINAPNATPVLHIVQNKGTGTTSNGTSAQQHNTFTGLSLVDAGLQQGGNQLLHIVNTGNQKNNNAGQLLKRVNLLTNLTNVQGSNEQKMLQFVCKSADGKSIQLNAPHQRSMVLRLQPIETPPVQTQQQTATKPAEQEQSPTAATSALSNKELVTSQQEIKSRSVYEENYAKFIQNSSNKTGNEKATSLPKFNQAFGKPVFQDGNQNTNDINSNTTHIAPVNTNSDNAECPPTDNPINLEHITQISSPPLLLRKSPAQTTQSQTNLVQHIKQTIAPMNIQTMHGGVIYTRQIPVNIGGGQTINLITVPSTELLDDSAQKQSSDVKFVNQSEIEPSIIKIVPQSQSAAGSDATTDENNHINIVNENTTTTHPQPVLTQMRIKLPMLSKTPQMVSGTRIVRPSFFQIQRNVISGTNQPVYQQLVLTAAPSLGQQTIRLPQAQVNRQIKVPSESTSSSESQMSSSTLEQLREFDMVLEQVKERSTVQPNTSTNSFKLHTTTDTNDNAVSASTTPTETTQQVLYSIGGNQPLNVAYVNRKATVTTPTTSTFVRSPDSSGIVDSPTSSHVQTPRTVTAEGSSSERAPVQPKPHKASSKKSRPKSSSNPPMKMSSVPPKTSTQKPMEDEQTTQRILYILAEYKEQVENSPDKDKPAPRRRTHPPSNPGSSKRKKGSRRNRDLSPSMGDDSCRTMGSEDSSCGTSQGDCTESCLETHSPQDSPRKVARKLTFEQEQPPPQPRPQPQRNVIVADGQTITVARGTAGKPTTAVLMPANYILPVSMVKGGQQIAIVTNRGPKLLTVGGGEGGATNALLLQRLIGPAGLKPVLARPGVRHVRLPTAALHNLQQTFNLAAATTPAQPPDSTEASAPEPPPPELLEPKVESSPWTDRDTDSVKPDRASSPEGSEPWNLPSSADPHDYSYEETVRSDNLDRTVLDPIPDRYSPDMEAQRIFDKMFDVESKKSYIVDSQDDSPRCGYDIDASDEDKGYQVVQKKDHGSQRTRVAHVSAAALRHKYAILEHELRLQKSLSEECEDLGVDSPSAMELFPEAELLFAASPAHEHAAEPQPRAHTPQPTLPQVIQPDIDDQIATDGPPVRERPRIGTIDHEEFARAHPNTTFHTEPTDDGEVQPFTISGLKGRHITSTIFHAGRAPATVVMATPTAAPAPPKYDLENMLGALPASTPMGLAGTRYDTMLEIPAPTGNGAQVIRRLCYDDRRSRDRYLLDEPEGSLPASPDHSPDRAADLFWESNSASERSDRRVLDYSSDSDKCCKSPLPSCDETYNTDSSGGAAPRLLSVIQQARRTAPVQELDTRPLRVYPAAPAAARSLSGKVRAGTPSPPAAPSGGRRRAPRAPRRACHCCAGDPPAAAAAPPRAKRPRHRKPPPEHH